MESDSSSDDEFATAGSITRRKLLADFYGKSSTGEGKTGNRGAHGQAPSSSLVAGDHDAPERRGNTADAKNLDSPYFDVAAHTSTHVVNSSVYRLLEMDEQLTLQVRTLDSTTQNMVYENYSKFIDATDAVKSVGTNVAANQQGLKRLEKGMETIDEQSKMVEEGLGSLRDAVAEKIRVKRLLTKLDSLLKLPETLREHIAGGRYRTAASNFLRSTNILSKHSAGFESLQKIETECNAILQEMATDLNRNIRHWSGQENVLGTAGSTSDDEDSNAETLGGSGSMNEDDLPPDPPSSVSEIFECTGTLALLMGRGASVESYMSMSLAASVRFLDRQFDIHLLEIQEAALNAPLSSGISEEEAAFEGDHSGKSQQSHKGQHLVPIMVVDAILEIATLFRISFPETHQASEHGQLEEFVKEAMSSLLLHVRSVLLDYSVGLHQTQNCTSDDGQDCDGDGDELYEEVSGAMSILILSVRELASGLLLPEVSIGANIAAELVEQASDLMGTLVRRRVDQKFCDLRLRVVSHCLIPFATRIAGMEEQQDAGVATDQVIQIAVSDCLQLLDDTVRSIVSGREVLGTSATSVDFPMLKQSIQGSTGRFAAWLAGALEVLTGCESSDSIFSFEAAETKPVEVDGPAAQGAGSNSVVASQVGQDDLSDMSNQYDVLAEKIDKKIQELIATLEGEGKVHQSQDFALKMFQMCRDCERAFVDNMTHSIEGNVGGGKKGRSSGLFDDKRNVVLSEQERKTSTRFQLAASRILTLYATNLGFNAACALSSSLAAYSDTENECFPVTPSKAACHVLEIAKEVTISCEKLFGGKKHPGPLPSFSGVAVTTSQPILALHSSPLKGLQLDVERMFQQKISIYPHTSNALTYTHDAILTVFFKVVIKTIGEQTRRCAFSAGGFSHLLIDVELIRGMTPHYVGKKYQENGNDTCSSLSSLLTDVVSSAGERCDEIDFSDQHDVVQTAISHLKEFITSDPSMLRFIIGD